MYISSETYKHLKDAKSNLIRCREELQQEISAKNSVLAMFDAELLAINQALMLAAYEPFEGDSPCVPPIGGDL